MPENFSFMFYPVAKFGRALFFNNDLNHKKLKLKPGFHSSLNIFSVEFSDGEQ